MRNEVTNVGMMQREAVHNTQVLDLRKTKLSTKMNLPQQ
jgi:hypothetical protein